MSRSTRGSALRARLAEARSRRTRRRPGGLIVSVIVLVLLATLCCCVGDPPVAPPVEAPTADGAEPEGGAGRLAAPPIASGPAVPATPRPAFPPPDPDPLPWLDAFRLQVGARAPELSGCFVGAPRPGALAWSARVDPATGQVSDHRLEPVLDGDPPTTTQRACVLRVLSNPPYLLEGATVSRVSLTLEF